MHLCFHILTRNFEFGNICTNFNVLYIYQAEKTGGLSKV